jgi:uncharacterized protein (DUF2141 family)
MLAGSLAVGSVPAAADPLPAPSPTVDITTNIVGFRNDQGKALVAVFRSADGFPGDASKAVAKTAAPIAQGRARVVFQGLPAGVYAVAVIHDENGNGKLDTSWLGIPTEGIGASNDAKGKLGPPSFDAARMTVTAPGFVHTIHVVYL